MQNEAKEIDICSFHRLFGHEIMSHEFNPTFVFFLADFFLPSSTVLGRSCTMNFGTEVAKARAVPTPP